VRHAPDYDLWLYHTQERLRGIAVRVLEALAEFHLARGDATAALPCLQRVLTLEPWREEAHRQMMTTLARAGQRSAALRQYEQCVDSLASELGVPPSAATTQLYQQIRDGKFAAERGGATVSAPPPTLRPHLPAELTPIVGRERELAELAALLATPECRLISIVGPGGIGKTRLALALAHRMQTHFDAVALVAAAGYRKRRRGAAGRGGGVRPAQPAGRRSCGDAGGVAGAGAPRAGQRRASAARRRGGHRDAPEHPA
jgi:hypothetical protein